MTIIDTPSQDPTPPAPPAAPRPGGNVGQGSRPSAPGHARPPMGRPGSDPRFRGGRRPFVRRKVCRFCAEKVVEVDFKAIHVLRSFITARGKLISSRTTGNCARHQRQVALSVKRAQNLALLPFMGE